MRRYLFVAAVLFAGAAVAQDLQRVPTPDEIAFAQLPRDVQAQLAALSPREALQKYDYARQNLVALGTPDPSPERLRAQIEAVLAPRYTAVQSFSAGTTSFPPLSPLVPSVAFEYR
jgi:MoxR-like ATPase